MNDEPTPAAPAPETDCDKPVYHWIGATIERRCDD